MRILKLIPERIGFIALLILFLAVPAIGQGETRTSKQLWEEVKHYVNKKANELRGSAKRLRRSDVDRFKSKRIKLARKYAKLIRSRSPITVNDHFFLGMLYDVGGQYELALTSTRKYLSSLSPDSDPVRVQSIRKGVIVFAARTKEFDLMESTHRDWLSGETTPAERQDIARLMAVLLYKGKKFEKSVKYAEDAWQSAKKSPARNLSERRIKDKLYGDLVEILAMSYRRSGRKDDAINLLAEGRAMSFTIPSARLYRKVMQVVNGLRVSEKRLMERLESFDTGSLAPGLSIAQWIGSEPKTLEDLRGKVVLLDFWYTWCGPCIKTFPRLRSWDRKYAKKGLVIVGVTGYTGNIKNEAATKPEEYEYILKFLKRHRLRYLIALQDDKTSTESEYGVGAYPTTVLIDRKGIIRYIGVGAGAEENANLGSMINKVIKEEVVFADIDTGNSLPAQ